MATTTSCPCWASPRIAARAASRGVFATERLTFSDNGLWGTDGNYPYFFTYRFGAFPKDRQQANSPRGPLYSLPAGRRNYGIALLGVKGDTLPVRVWTSVNYENPAMKNNTSRRPAPMPLTLTVVVSGLTPGVNYRLYRYDSLAAIPDSDFNARAAQAAEARDVRIDSGAASPLRGIFSPTKLPHGAASRPARLDAGLRGPKKSADSAPPRA